MPTESHNITSLPHLVCLKFEALDTQILQCASPEHSPEHLLLRQNLRTDAGNSSLQLRQEVHVTFQKLFNSDPPLRMHTLLDHCGSACTLALWKRNLAIERQFIPVQFVFLPRSLCSTVPKFSLRLGCM